MCRSIVPRVNFLMVNIWQVDNTAGKCPAGKCSVDKILYVNVPRVNVFWVKVHQSKFTYL